MSESVIERVTFFEDRAEVSRRISVPLAGASENGGVTEARVDGLAVTIDDSSLVAGIAADSDAAEVLAARVRRITREIPAAGSETIAALDEQLSAARGKLAAAERALTRARAEVTRASALLARWADGLQRAPVGGGDEMNKWSNAYAVADAAQSRALDTVATRSAQLDEVRRDVQHTEARLRQAQLTTPRYEAAAEIRLHSDRAQTGTVSLRYRTPLALWRPEHAARLIEHDGKFELAITTIATVWQRTGEEWRDVACRFSTARPAQAAAPPLLSDDPVRLQKRVDRSVTVEARDQTIASAGLAGTRAVDEMPGVEDGGEPLSFVATHPVTIPGDGQPFRVEVGERRLPCTVELVVFPERSEAAHVRVEATLTGDTPLLAGPVRLARGGSLVGRGKTGFVALGEPFELGFGIDDGVRVRRRVDEERDTTAIIGTQKIKRTVKLFVSNLGGQPRRIQVIERVPVSEIGDVTIAVLDKGGARLDDDGFAHFDVQLLANGTRELTLVYRIEAAAKVRLPF